MSVGLRIRLGAVTLLLCRWISRSCGQDLCEPDKFGNCPFLAREGKCATGIDDERTSAWVIHRCPRSCKENDCFDPCTDLVPECLEWERQGKCFHDADFMLRNCRKTCNSYPCKVRNRPFHPKEWIAGKATELNTREYCIEKALLGKLSHTIYRRDPSLGSFLIPTQKVRATPWLYLSNLGLELAGGESTDITDYVMEQALATAILKGINVIATTISDRDQKSEMNVGRALRAVAQFNISRSALFISSRAGFLPRDPFHSGFLKWWEQLQRNGRSPDNFVGNHCILPGCLLRSLERTLSNIGISTLDVLFLETPAEAQLGKVTREEFMSRLKVAFKFLEDRRKNGMIQSYGISTWDCLLRDPTDRLYLGLQEVVDIAREVGGIDHGFRYIQVPVTAALPSLWTTKYQRVDRAGGGFYSVPKAAAMLGLGVMGSSPTMHGDLLDNMSIKATFERLNPLVRDRESFGRELVNFARSTPYVTSALVEVQDLPLVVKQLELTKEASWSAKFLYMVQKQLASLPHTTTA